MRTESEKTLLCRWIVKDERVRAFWKRERRVWWSKVDAKVGKFKFSSYAETQTQGPLFPQTTARQATAYFYSLHSNYPSRIQHSAPTFSSDINTSAPKCQLIPRPATSVTRLFPITNKNQVLFRPLGHLVFFRKPYSIRSVFKYSISMVDRRASLLVLVLPVIPLTCVYLHTSRPSRFVP